MADFIFMLTRNDRTVDDAYAIAGKALDAGLRHVGFKDIGLPAPDLARIASLIRSRGGTVYLEVVSIDEASEARSAAAALDIGVDRLLGGTRPHVVLPIVAGSSIGYYPFCGRIVGHPSALEGTIGEIVASAAAHTAHDRVAGLDLLAYRWAGDAPALIRAVCSAVKKPVIVAGSIDGPERIRASVEAGAAGFTIGTAVLDGKFPVDGQFRGDPAALHVQLGAVRAAMDALVP